MLQLSQALTIPESATKAAGQVFKLAVGSILSKVVAHIAFESQSAGLG